MPSAAHIDRGPSRRLVTSAALAIIALFLTSCPCDDKSKPTPGGGPTVCHKDFQALSQMPPIQLGCDFENCCPNCAVTDPVDLHVAVSGELIDYVRLVLDDGSGAPITTSVGASVAQATYPTSVEVSQGETQLRGIGSAAGALLPVLYPRIYLQAVPPLEPGQQQSDRPYEYADVVYPLRLEIAQSQNGETIKKNVFEYQIVNCTDFVLVNSDILEVQENGGSDVSVVLSSGMRKGDDCVRNYPHRISAASAVGNYLSPNAGCYTEIGVYSDDDAITLLGNETATDWSTWTAMPWDKQTAVLSQPRWQMPVKLWIVARQDRQAKLHGWAQDDALLADHYLNTNHAGIDVWSLKDIEVVPDDCLPESECLVDSLITDAWTIWNSCWLDVINGIKANAAIYDPSKLNVYYVDEPRISGVHCRLASGESANIVLVGAGSKPETLAHELGHALSLRHADKCIAFSGIDCVTKVSKDYNGDDDPDFTDDNIMWSAGTGRTQFTEGQDFRMTFDQYSLLNTAGTRTAGPAARDCPDDADSEQCPWIGLDYSPN